MATEAIEKAHVLFLCTANSARSQIAEGLLREYGGDRFEVHSAGLEPKDINPLAIEVMNEIGIDITGQYSKSLSDFLGKVPVRFAIIVCDKAEVSCPRIWPFGTTVLSWPFDDPAAVDGRENALVKFREVRDQIKNRVRRWLADQ